MGHGTTHRHRLAGVLLAVGLVSGCAGALRWSEPAADTHRVAVGETWYSIAFRNQLQARTLAHWNGLEVHHPIYPGQLLKLYPPIPGETRQPPPRPRTTAAPRPPSRVRAGKTPAAPAPSRPAPASPPAPMRAPEPRMPSAAPYRWQWPAKGEVIARYAPAQGRKGIYISGKAGDPVRASAGGKVVYSGSALKGYGLLLIVKHDEDFLTAYGHNRRLLVSEGDRVKAGQRIAEMGVGPGQKPLLHFEIRERAKPVDPLPLLPRTR